VEARPGIPAERGRAARDGPGGLRRWGRGRGIGVVIRASGVLAGRRAFLSWSSEGRSVTSRAAPSDKEAPGVGARHHAGNVIRGVVDVRPGGRRGCAPCSAGATA